ncbi:MAG: peroxiredoxin [Candidatus Doudnabacteria bacterium]
MIKLNHEAPDFTLPDSTGKMVTLSSFKEKNNVVLVMYPGDDTEGCVTQLCAIKDRDAEFVKRDTIVLGINHADSKSHQKFIDKYGLTMQLLVDEGREVIEAYNAQGTFMNRTSTIRTVFIIDKNGYVQYTEQGTPEVQELLDVIDTLNK